MSEYYSATLANGLRLLVTQLPHLHSAEVVCYVGVGVRNEPAAMAGVSHFVEHMVFRGNEKYSSGPLIEQAFERLGGSINAATDAETTSFDFNVHPDSVTEALQLLGALLRQPLFKSVETEREIILEEALGDFNEQGEDICLENRIAQMMWGEHSLGLPVIGFPDTIRRLTLDDICNWHKKYYVPNNIVISVAGPVDIATIHAAVEQAFCQWQPQEVPAVQPFRLSKAEDGPQCCWVRDSGSQLSLQLAWRTDGSLAPTSLGTRILRRILGDGGACRLMQRLREDAGLTYNVDASLEEYAECGCFSIDLSTDPEKLVPAVKILIEEAQRACELVPDAELQRAVQLGLYRLHFSRDNVEELAVRYGWGEMSGNMHTLRDDTQALQQVTSAMVQDAARACLRPERCYFACIGPWREADKHEVENLLRGYSAPRAS
ncbi:MAG: pitrilysin family protein [Desulfuromonas sp.]|nr:pitrilysin family protein [Desulfuromonas sp.]